VQADVVSIHVLPWQLQELVFVFPAKRLLLELFGLVRWQRRLGNFGDQVRRRRFSQTIDQDTEKWDLDESVEAKPKAKQDTSAILEPQLLLIFVVANARKIWLKLSKLTRLCREVGPSRTSSRISVREEK